MNCRTFEKRLFDYQDGTLAAGEKAEFERHRLACPRCAAWMEAESHTAGVFRAVVRDACEGLDLGARSGARLVSAMQRAHSPSPARRGWQVAAAVAALVLVALLVRPIVREIGRAPAEPPTRHAVAEKDRSWAEEIDVTYESGLGDETTLISHDSGTTSIIEIQVSYHPLTNGRRFR